MSQLIFIIEDEKDIRDSIAEAVESEGYSTISASNGRDAILMFDENSEKAVKMPDLILLDYLMPHLNGAGFLEQAKKNKRLAKIPVVMITADRKSAQKASDFGVAGHLHKPLELEDLFAAIERHLH